MEPSLLAQLSDPDNLFILAGLLMVLAELFVGIDTGLDLMILGSILVISGFVGLGFSTPFASTIVAIILVFIYFLFGRQFVKSKIILATNHTNIDKLVGKKAKACKAIASGEVGQIDLDGELWRAKSDESITVGEKVEIVSISGVTLEVKKIKK